MRRTPLVAGGFIAGALIGALPPVQQLSASWQCTSTGGRYDAALRVCDYRAPATPQLPPRIRLLDDGDR